MPHTLLFAYLKHFKFENFNPISKLKSIVSYSINPKSWKRKDMIFLLSSASLFQLIVSSLDRTNRIVLNWTDYSILMYSITYFYLLYFLQQQSQDLQHPQWNDPNEESFCFEWFFRTFYHYQRIQLLTSIHQQ